MGYVDSCYPPVTSHITPRSVTSISSSWPTKCPQQKQHIISA